MKQTKIPNNLGVSAVIGYALLSSGCASVFNGRTQAVRISSQPPGAEVRIDGSTSGTTPQTAKLSRKTSHRIELRLTGFQPYEVVLEPAFNGATVGNVLVGGFIGLAVDGSTGAGNTLHPDKVEAVLVRREPSAP